MIRVFVAEDQKTVQQILKSYLELEPDLEVVGTAVNGQLAIDRVETLKPDVVIMDIEMPEVDGLTATQVICKRFGETKVLILSVHDNDRYLNNALRVGAKGYLLKTTPPKELVNAIRAIHQGYFQLGPGLLEKFHKDSLEKFRDRLHNSLFISPAKNSTKSEGLNSEKTNLSHPENNVLHTFGTEIFSWSGQPKTKHKYLALGFLLNASVWLLVLVYLKFFPHIYTSKWGLKILETNPSIQVILPNGNKTADNLSQQKSNKSLDPRTDYVYIAKSHRLLEKAAQKFEQSRREFGVPKITIEPGSDLITFEIQGSSPVQAQRKALMIHELMVQQIAQLRQAELKRQDQEIKAELESDRVRFHSLQEQLTRFRVNTSADKQIDELLATIEQLHRQRSSAIAQEMELKNRYAQLAKNIQLSPQETLDAYKLRRDSIYQQYLSVYSQAKKELANLSAEYTNKHPWVVAQQAEVSDLTKALQKQAAIVLGRAVSLEALNKLILSNAEAKKEDLAQDLVTNQANRQKLVERDKQLQQQIATLEKHLQKLSQQKLELDRLKRDLKVAETVFNSTLTKLNLSKETVYANYPRTQLVIAPSLPDPNEPIVPDLNLALLSGLAGSFVVSTSLFLYKANQFRLEQNQRS
jgi:DNA-binding NarL/FixJ family response regulator/uncharacterized protein involved in exopolysaccharide biosynthesis